MNLRKERILELSLLPCDRLVLEVFLWCKYTMDQFALISGEKKTYKVDFKMFLPGVIKAL